MDFLLEMDSIEILTRREKRKQFLVLTDHTHLWCLPQLSKNPETEESILD
jgi:hypothetical protein